MIDLPEMITHKYLTITAGGIMYFDPRQNYYFCSGLMLLLSYKPIKDILIQEFSQEGFDDRYKKISNYFRMLSLIHLYYDEKDNKEKPNTNILNSKTFSEIARIQMKLPEIYETLWEMLIPAIRETNLSYMQYKDQHFKGFKDKMRKINYTPGKYLQTSKQV